MGTIKKVCRNCIYFHDSPTIAELNRTYGKKFGACWVNCRRDVKSEKDTCEDFSTGDKMYHVNKNKPKKGIFSRLFK